MRSGYQVSIALNAVLLAAVVLLWRDKHSSSAIPAPPEAAVARPSPATRRAAPPAHAPTSPVRIGDDWHHWIGPLRDAHVPTNVLAGLVQADFEHRWQSRQAVLQQQYMRGAIDADGLAAAGLEHDAELDRELEAALGPDAYRAWDMRRVLQGTNVDRLSLSDAERIAVYELERGLQDDLRKVEMAKLKGAIDPATFTQRQQEVQDAAAHKLRELLGEPRAAQLQGADDTAGRLKRAFDRDLSPAQLDALATTQRAWDHTRSNLATLEVNTDDPALEDRLRASEAAYRAQFDRIAGPGASDRYDRSEDSRYRELSRYAAKWGVPTSEVAPVFATLTDFESAVRSYTRDADDRGIDPATRQAAILGFEQKMEQSLEVKLGPATYDRLRRNGVTLVTTP